MRQPTIVQIRTLGVLTFLLILGQGCSSVAPFTQGIEPVDDSLVSFCGTESTPTMGSHGGQEPLPDTESGRPNDPFERVWETLGEFDSEHPFDPTLGYRGTRFSGPGFEEVVRDSDSFGECP